MNRAAARRAHPPVPGGERGWTRADRISGMGKIAALFSSAALPVGPFMFNETAVPSRWSESFRRSQTPTRFPQVGSVQRMRVPTSAPAAPGRLISHCSQYPRRGWVPVALGRTCCTMPPRGGAIVLCNDGDGRILARSIPDDPTLFSRHVSVSRRRADAWRRWLLRHVAPRVLLMIYLVAVSRRRSCHRAHRWKMSVRLVCSRVPQD